MNFGFPDFKTFRLFKNRIVAAEGDAKFAQTTIKTSLKIYVDNTKNNNRPAAHYRRAAERPARRRPCRML
jgi:hypothetical protein